MHKTVKISDGLTVSVVPAGEMNSAITDKDAEMDLRAREAVKSAINRAKVCGKPIAKYDPVSKRAYIENAAGEKKYV